MVSVKNLSKDRDVVVPCPLGSARARQRFIIARIAGGLARRPLSPSSRKGGFTILEVVMATMVLALAIGSALTVLAQGFASLDSSRCISYASQIMQSELEKMRMTAWGDGSGGAGSGTAGSGVSGYPAAATNVPLSSNFGLPGNRMTLTRQVEDVHDGMLKITFVIRWTSHSGQSLSRSYVTYYGKNGLYDYFSG